MADRPTIEATLERYYRAWTDDDAELYATVWAEGATFADPPSDVDPPPLGFEQILAGFRDVQGRAQGISYERQYTWHCGHSVAVHSIVTMKLASGVAKVPLVHTFRFDEGGLVRRLEAFLDFDLITMAEGTRPDWMTGPAH